ncbi:MAG: tryptophanase [Lachnoclostridium sp.]|jgi:tryptophanase|nr:tryptophanase [Lachnoclostridium sp.]
MTDIKFIKTEPVPVEMHKVRIVQKIQLIPLKERIERNREAGNNAHLLKNEDVFLDMLTDSGVNAMSDQQLAAMIAADDAYAGSASYYKLEEKSKEIFGMKYFVPSHQGRACEHLLFRVFTKPDMQIPMNYHFTTTKALLQKAGAKVVELLIDEGLNPESSHPFKGNFDMDKLKRFIQETGIEKIGLLRVEAGTNLIGGQPISLENIKQVTGLCREKNIKTLLDASLLADNLYFIKTREEAYKDVSLPDIIKEISDCFDIIYFSGRKLTCARGGGMCFRHEEDYKKVRDLVPLYEGFATYGGISVREIEAMAIGLEETLDEDMISQGPIFIEEMTNLLTENGVPMVTPGGGLGVHLDCARFLPHVSPTEYPGAAVACALYLISGIRGTERGTLSEDRDEQGEEVTAKMELLRLALPRRVFTLSQIKYAVDRIIWLHENRDIIAGLKFVEEPEVMRFFFGKLEPVGDWQEKLVKKFEKDFGIHS